MIYIFRWLLTLGLAAAAPFAAGVTICEQLILPGVEAHSWRPHPAPQLTVRAALARGRTWVGLTDGALLARVRSELPDGFMIVGVGALTVRAAVDTGQFTGDWPTATQRAAVRDPGDFDIDGRWLRGVIPQDFDTFANDRGLLEVIREAARVEAAGGYLLRALGFGQHRYAALIPTLGELAQREGTPRRLRELPRHVRGDETLSTLALEIVRDAVEPTAAAYVAASARRGFLLILKRSAYAHRAHVEDPDGVGSIISLAKDVGIVEADVHALVPLANVDLTDLIRTGPVRRDRASSSGRLASAPPAGVVVGQARARRP